jgi:hypothetical protein
MFFLVLSDHDEQSAVSITRPGNSANHLLKNPLRMMIPMADVLIQIAYIQIDTATTTGMELLPDIPAVLKLSS